MSVSITGCMEYETVVVAPNKNDTRNDTIPVYANQPYYDSYYNYYFNGYYSNPHHFWWPGHRGALCYNSRGRAKYYGPRQSVSSNIHPQVMRAPAAKNIARGGFGSTAHSTSLARSVAS